MLAAVSGGVDSSVAAALVHKAIGDQLVAVFVDTGLLRKGEPEQVVRQPSASTMGAELVAVDAAGEFFDALKGVTDPEQKRKIVGEKFIRIFEREARKLGPARFLVQGTIYPDVVEFVRAGPEQGRHGSRRHHNVGGLPEDMDMSTWSSRCAICSRTRCGRWAKPWACRRAWSGGSRSRVPG